MRFKLTLQHLRPDLHTIRCLPPDTNFECQYTLYESKAIDYLQHLRVELDRIVTHPGRVWIAREPLPVHVSIVWARLGGRLRGF